MNKLTRMSFSVLLFAFVAFCIFHALPTAHAQIPSGGCGAEHFDIRDGLNYVRLGNRIHDPCL